MNIGTIIYLFKNDLKKDCKHLTLNEVELNHFNISREIVKNAYCIKIIFGTNSKTIKDRFI